jgi:hypothetical protein
MSEAEALTLDSSLFLIKRKDFTIEVGSSTWDGRKKRTWRGKFDYKGVHHNFSVTDPIVRDAFERLFEATINLAQFPEDQNKDNHDYEQQERNVHLVVSSSKGLATPGRLLN